MSKFTLDQLTEGIRQRHVGHRVQGFAQRRRPQADRVEEVRASVAGRSPLRRGVAQQQ